MARAGYHPGKDEEKKSGLKEQGFYHTPAWRRVRRLALQRDNYLCQKCLKEKGQVTPATEVHHLVRVDDDPQLALALANLQSLCWDCHESTKDRRRARKALPRGVRVVDMSE